MDWISKLGVPIRAVLEIAWRKHDCLIPCHCVFCIDSWNRTCPPDVALGNAARGNWSEKLFQRNRACAKFLEKKWHFFFPGRMFTWPLHIWRNKAAFERKISTWRFGDRYRFYLIKLTYASEFYLMTYGRPALKRVLHAHSQNCEKRLLASSFLSLSFSLSVHMEQLCSHWTDFHEIWYWKIFRKSDEFQV